MSINLRAFTDATGTLAFRDSPARVAAQIRGKGWTDKDLVCAISRPKRGTRANAYYHAGVVEPIRAAIEEAHGKCVTHAECHGFLKTRYAEREPVVDLVTGEMLPGDLSTRHMSVARFARYIDDCTLFGSEYFYIDWAQLDRQRLLDEQGALITIEN